MTDRRLAVLAAVAAGMLLFTIILYSVTGARRGAFKGGSLFIQGLDPAKIGAISVKRGDDVATLARRSDGFVVAEKNNYPASVSEINDLLIKVMEIRCADKITDDPRKHGDLAVAADSDDSTTVTISDAEGKTLVAFTIGKSPERGAGAYVRRLSEDTVYLTADWLNAGADPIRYVETKLLSVPQDDVESVSVKTGDDSYSIIRDEKGEIALGGVPEGKRPKKDEYEGVFKALSSVNLSDIVRLSDLETTWDADYTCGLKRGLTYSVTLAKKDDKHYVKLAAQGPPVGSVTITQTESHDELKKKEALLLAADTAETFTAQHTGWAYQISSWSAEKMRKPFADLIEDIPSEETPDEIAASHIVVSFKGTEGSESERTREEARALAGL